MKKMTGIVMLGMLMLPNAAFAQTEDVVIAAAEPVPVSATATEPDSVPATAADIPESSDPPAPNASAAVQDTANAQVMIEGDILEDTANPETQPNEDLAVTEIVEATSTEATIEVVADPAASDVPVEDAVIEEPVLDVVAESLIAEPISAPTQIDAEIEKQIELKIEVDPAYVVTLSGKTIPTKKKGMIGTTDLTAPVTTDVDAQTGVITVSGSCASPYYVVLIFRNQTDYEADPRSFIVNRAYPCENGSYSYSIDRLPPTLPNGTYYLMIGEQGERGAWTPATGLTEVSINRTN